MSRAHNRRRHLPRRIAAAKIFSVFVTTRPLARFVGLGPQTTSVGRHVAKMVRASTHRSSSRTAEGAPAPTSASTGTVWEREWMRYAIAWLSSQLKIPLTVAAITIPVSRIAALWAGLSDQRGIMTPAAPVAPREVGATQKQSAVLARSVASPESACPLMALVSPPSIQTHTTTVP